MPEEEQISIPQKEGRKKTSPLSPLGWMLISLAMFIDIMGILIVLAALLFAPLALLGYIFSILGTVTIGIWSWRNDGSIPVSKKVIRYLKRFGLEWIPFLRAAPLWTIFVIKGLLK